MKKGKSGLILLAVVFILVITGCKKEETANNNPKVEQGNSEIGQPTVTIDLTEKLDKEEELKNENEKNLKEFTEHELNIIDDNYRTYYEIFVYSFYDSDGDGIGDLQGVIQKLDYIQEMGFNGIWLMPIMPSDSYHKYDVIDYYKIDPEYGTMEDFKELVDACNKRGIKLIIDLVLNHSSSKHTWFVQAEEYLKSLQEGEEALEEVCPYIGYYNIVKGKPNSGVYYQIGTTDYYYEGVFWSGMPDLNLENEALRKELEDIMTFWLDLGVGGFRLDAAKEFYTGSIDKNIEVLRWITDFVKLKGEDNYLVAEVWDSYNNSTQYYKSGIDSIFNFSFADSEGKITKVLNYTGSQNSARSYAEALVKYQERIKSFNENAIDAPFFVNHDVARAAGYFSYNEDKIKMAGALNLLMTGSAFVYYGEEIGMTGSGKDENKRAPMIWSKTDTKGLTNGPKDMEEIEHRFAPLDEQLKNPLSIAVFYKHLIRLRNENPEIGRGVVVLMEEVTDEDIAAFTKEYEKSSVGILINLSDKDTKQVKIDLNSYGFKEIRNFLSVDGSEVTLEGDIITLPPYSLALLK